MSPSRRLHSRTTVDSTGRRALSSAWKSTWFATRWPGVQIPQRPPLHYSAVSWFSIFSRPLRVTSLMPETLQTSLWVLGEELFWDAL